MDGISSVLKGLPYCRNFCISVKLSGIFKYLWQHIRIMFENAELVVCYAEVSEHPRKWGFKVFLELPNFTWYDCDSQRWSKISTNGLIL